MDALFFLQSKSHFPSLFYAWICVQMSSVWHYSIAQRWSHTWTWLSSTLQCAQWGLAFLCWVGKKCQKIQKKYNFILIRTLLNFFLACLVEWPSLSSPHWQFLKLCFWPTSAVLYKYCCARYPFATSLCFEPKGCINVKAVILESPAQFMALSIKKIQECSRRTLDTYLEIGQIDMDFCTISKRTSANVLSAVKR